MRIVNILGYLLKAKTGKARKETYFPFLPP